MEDEVLWDAFKAATLLEGEWTHTTHLRVAWLFSSRHAIDEAHVLMRVGIIRMNAAQGLVETPQRGYHETITRAWLQLVRSLRSEFPVETSKAFVAAGGAWLERDALLRYYSRARLTSVEARARFVEPDLEPLPVSA